MGGLEGHILGVWWCLYYHISGIDANNIEILRVRRFGSSWKTETKRVLGLKFRY